MNKQRYDYQLTKNIPLTPDDDISLDDFKFRLERLAQRLEEEDEHGLVIPK